jgi:hypothetical protein
LLPFLMVSAGVLVAAAILWSLLGRAIALPGVVALVAVAILSWVAVQQVYGGVRELDSTRKQNNTKGEAQQRLDCLTRTGNASPEKLRFIAWLDRELPRDARYELFMNPVDVPCFSLALLPRVAVDPGGRPTHRVFFGVVPPVFARDFARQANGSRRFGPALGYAPVTP